MIYSILGVCLVVVFYGALPVLGALWVRGHWRRFRSHLQNSTLFPMAEYAQFRGQTSAHSYRFFGTLEAIEGSERMWLGNGRISVSVEMKGVIVYILPEPGNLDDPPQQILWKDLHTLHEGTQFFVFGTLFTDRGQGVFRSDESQPLLVVIYEGTQETFLTSAIHNGRQKNEFWNFMTPISLAAGIIALIFLSFISLPPTGQQPFSLWLFTLAIVPNTFFLPPGVLFYLFFLRFWKESRVNRTHRDRIGLPFRYFKNPPGQKVEDLRATLPNGQTYVCLSSQGSLPLHVKSPESLTKIGDDALGETSYLFGVLEEGVGGGHQLSRPRDPMADYIEVFGNPWELYLGYKKKARIGEILAFLSFALGTILNGILVGIILSQWFL